MHTHTHTRTHTHITKLRPAYTLEPAHRLAESVVLSHTRTQESVEKQGRDGERWRDGEIERWRGGVIKEFAVFYF